MASCVACGDELLLVFVIQLNLASNTSDRLCGTPLWRKPQTAKCTTELFLLIDIRPISPHFPLAAR